MKISMEPEYRNIALGNKSATGYKSGSNLVQCGVPKLVTTYHLCFTETRFVINI